jgi:hypothetical protein
MNVPGATHGIMISNEPIDYDILNDCLEDGTNQWTQEKKGEQETIFWANKKYKRRMHFNAIMMFFSKIYSA